MYRKTITLLLCIFITIGFFNLAQAQSSSQVETVQQKLENRNFDPGPVDGKWGPKTRSAL